MTRRLLITYLTISALALAALAIPLGITFAQRERDRLYFEIERDASAVSALSEDALENGTPPPLDATLAHYRETTRGRIVVVDKSGKSVADSNDPNAPAENYTNRPGDHFGVAGPSCESGPDTRTPPAARSCTSRSQSPQGASCTVR